MKLILISSPNKEKEEIQTMVRLLDHGLYRLHIRKPSWSKAQMEELIEQVPTVYYSKISFHEHHELVHQYGVGGTHFKSDQLICPGSVVTSKSFHKLEDLQESPNAALDYSFISPVFDSISKPGYRQAFTTHKLSEWTAAYKGDLPFQLFALGGITPEHLPYLDSIGFDGAAIMGGIWNGENTEIRLKRFLNYKNTALK
ncbi:thiamine phosphate synthase [Echinicola soli]|uniref:Thiamine phosphate synthase n=1 Tax=Echinicola soli TaxID=2591634 RepID=A0A514CKN4_9BACT|nr:thiamine phosphate synthase [Echinicola soli]QDH80393.1 thiamine phosphate synthase [Echinicola soli]